MLPEVGEAHHSLCQVHGRRWCPKSCQIRTIEGSWALGRGLGCPEHPEVSLTDPPRAGVCCRETGKLWRWLQFSGYWSTAAKGNPIIKLFFMQVPCRDHPHPKAVPINMVMSSKGDLLLAYILHSSCTNLDHKGSVWSSSCHCSQSPLTSPKLLCFYSNHKIKQLRWKCGVIKCNPHSRWGKQQNMLERRKDGTSENTLFMHFHDYFIWTFSESGCKCSVFFTLPFNSTWNMRLKPTFSSKLKRMDRGKNVAHATPFSLVYLWTTYVHAQTHLHIILTFK